MKGPESRLNRFFNPESKPAKLSQYSQESITESDLEPHTARELTIMRNEIYARHGRIFQNSELRSHFEAQSWHFIVMT